MSLNAIITADVKGFEAGVDKAVQAIDKLAKTANEKLESIGKGFDNVGKKASIMSAAIVAAGGVMVSSFITQEKAERKLSAAINATGGDVEVLSARFKKFASDLQSVTLTGDETTLGMLQMAQTMGLTAGQSERAVKNAIAMESAFGVSAASAMRYTAALEDGDATMLKRYIPALKAIEDESLLAAKAQEILGNAFEVAKEDAQTFGGSLTQLKNSAGDLMEEFGAIISKALMPLVEWAKNAVEYFSNLDEDTKELIVTVGGIVAAIGPLLLILGTIVGKVVPAMLVGFKSLSAVVMTTGGAFAKLGVIIAANPIGAIAVGITAAIAALVIFNRRLSDTATLSDKVMSDALKNTAGERIEVERLLRVLNSENSTREQKEGVLVKLNKISPEYFKNIKLEGDAVKEANEQAIAYNKSLVEKARLLVINEKLVELERKRIDELEGADDSKLSFWQKLVKNTLIANGELAASDDYVTKTREANAEKSKTAYETQRDALLALLDAAEDDVVPPPSTDSYTPVFVEIKDEIAAIDDEWDLLLKNVNKNAPKLEFDEVDLGKPFGRMGEILADYEKKLRQAEVSNEVFGDSFNKLDADINATTQALQTMISEGFEVGDIGVDALMWQLERLREGLQETAAVVVDYGSIIAGGIADFAASIGEAFADGNFEGLGSGLISAMGSMLSQFGAMLISAAVGAEALQALITQPWLALAAGIALVALGAAVSKSAQGMVSRTTGGGGGGSMGGTNSYNKTSSLGDSIYRGAYKDDWGSEVVFKIGNNELVGVLENASNRRNRL